MAASDWHLLWVVVGCLVLGAVCGAALRFLFFVVVAPVAVAVLVAIGAATGHALSTGVAAIIALQLGYGLGVIGRASLRDRPR